MTKLRVFGTLITAVLTVAGLTLAAGIAAAGSAAAVAPTRPACAASQTPPLAACLVLIRTDIKQRPESAFGDKAPKGFGYGPADLVGAYKLGSLKTIRKIAVVDAYNDPKAAADLATYRSAWGLPKCRPSTKAGCLTVTNEFGASKLPKNAGGSGWATEASVDVDMVSAICPSCQIFLVEAGSASLKDLGTAVNTAVKVLGAKYVSNSYGSPESRAELGYDTKYYKHAGVAVTAAAGDSGYGVSYPAASPWVTAVGGTTLTKGGGNRGWTETVWGGRTGQGTGSGCSKFEPRPPMQQGKDWLTKGCTHRIDNDVAAVANPGTGVASYDTYDQHGWLEVGGTGVSAPIIAAVYALAGVPAAGTFPVTYPYHDPGELNDVTKGLNGTCSSLPVLCHAGPHYDGPTGCGTPNGRSTFVRPKTAVRTRGAGRVLRPGMSGHPCLLVAAHNS
jgi:hypothetical protein